MAAKEHLILSYVGMNDGQELAPAIPMVGVETVLEKGFHLRKTRVSLKPLELDSLKKCHQEEIKAAVTESLPPAPAPLPEEMSLYTLAELLTRNCKSFFKYRYGFEYSAKEKTALVSDDPETLSPLDNSLLLKALWALRLDKNIPETEWIKYVEKARFLPVNGQELFDNAAGIIANAGAQTKLGSGIRKLFSKEKKEAQCAPLDYSRFPKTTFIGIKGITLENILVDLHPVIVPIEDKIEFSDFSDACDFSNRMLSIHCDARYGEADIKYICGQIANFYDSYTQLLRIDLQHITHI